MPLVLIGLKELREAVSTCVGQVGMGTLSGPTLKQAFFMHTRSFINDFSPQRGVELYEEKGIGS